MKLPGDLGNLTHFDWKVDHHAASRHPNGRDLTPLGGDWSVGSGVGDPCRLTRFRRMLSSMSDMAERLNAALEGRYAIERELGAGGMARKGRAIL